MLYGDVLNLHNKKSQMFPLQMPIYDSICNTYGVKRGLALVYFSAIFFNQHSLRKKSLHLSSKLYRKRQEVKLIKTNISDIIGVFFGWILTISFCKGYFHWLKWNASECYGHLPVWLFITTKAWLSPSKTSQLKVKVCERKKLLQNIKVDNNNLILVWCIGMWQILPCKTLFNKWPPSKNNNNTKKNNFFQSVPLKSSGERLRAIDTFVLFYVSLSDIYFIFKVHIFIWVPVIKFIFNYYTCSYFLLDYSRNMR